MNLDTVISRLFSSIFFRIGSTSDGSREEKSKSSLSSAESSSRRRYRVGNKCARGESESQEEARKTGDMCQLSVPRVGGERDVGSAFRAPRLSATWRFVVIVIVVVIVVVAIIDGCSGFSSSVATPRAGRSHARARAPMSVHVSAGDAMQGVGVQAETARQIVEFEELVSRLDRINGVVARQTSTATSTSVPSPSPPMRASRLTGTASSLPYDRRPCASSAATRDSARDNERIRVHIGIDEDLRMILEMDPSIVDGILSPDNHPPVAQSLRATRPQGWYCTDRDSLVF